jgi:hypothetical protein
MQDSWTSRECACPDHVLTSFSAFCFQQMGDIVQYYLPILQLWVDHVQSNHSVSTDIFLRFLIHARLVLGHSLLYCIG